MHRRSSQQCLKAASVNFNTTDKARTRRFDGKYFASLSVVFSPLQAFVLLLFFLQQQSL